MSQFSILPDSQNQKLGFKMTWKTNSKIFEVSEFSTWSNESTYKSIQIPDAHSEPCQTSKMELFGKMVRDFQSLTIFEKSSM